MALYKEVAGRFVRGEAVSLPVIAFLPSGGGACQVGTATTVAGAIDCARAAGFAASRCRTPELIQGMVISIGVNVFSEYVLVYCDRGPAEGSAEAGR